jgi:hypothetical protein
LIADLRKSGNAEGLRESARNDEQHEASHGLYPFREPAGHATQRRYGRGLSESESVSRARTTLPTGDGGEAASNQSAVPPYGLCWGPVLPS